MSISRKLKIGIICFPSFGGSGALAAELGKKLARRGHKIHIIASEVPFRLFSPWQKNLYYHQPYLIDYPLFDKESLSPLLCVNKIIELVRLEKLDLVHAHYALPFSTVLVLAKKILKAEDKNTKIITTLHGTDVSIFSKQPQIIDVLKYSLEKNDAVTAVCKYTAETAKENLGLAKTPQVIYNFVDIKREPEIKNKELRSIFAQENEKIIIHASNFREVKRIQDVISIFKEVNKKIPSKLLLCGDGPEQRTAQKFASKYGIINKIHFMGLQSNISKLLSISDIFLLPSETEGFSLAALEAMSCKVPVAGSDVGGTSEMIEDGVDGFISPVGDIKLMTEKISKLLLDKKLYKKIANNAYNKVNKHFNSETITDQYEKLYEEVLSRR